MYFSMEDNTNTSSSLIDHNDLFINTCTLIEKYGNDHFLFFYHGQLCEEFT